MIATAVHRLDLYLLRNVDHKSFVSRYLQSAHIARSIHHLEDREVKALGAWIQGLFDTDGITDELMSACSPQDFHLLTASLFDQSIEACQTGTLTLNTVKNGFDFLFEPFLLPSLIAGLKWFGRKLWETLGTPSSLDTIIPILNHLLKPPSISSDARILHASVLSSVAKDLEETLTYILQKHPVRQDINPLLDTLKGHNAKHRKLAVAYTDVESWSSISGGLLGALRNRVRHLTQWDTSRADLSSVQYVHRLVIMAQRLLGSKAVLDTLVDEIVNVHNAGSSVMLEMVDVSVNSILDIAAMMIAAPTPDRMVSTSLHGELRIEAAKAYEISKTDMPRAITLTRLHRRVETVIFSSSTLPVINQDPLNSMSDSVVVAAPNIDDVLAQADERIGHQNFMNLDGDDLMMS